MHYGSEGVLQFTLYEGIEKLLNGLVDRGFDLYIATSKLRSMALEVVEHAGWTDRFKAVGGAEADGSRHHKKDVIEWTMTQVSGGSPVVAMVGDRAEDMAASRELDLRAIGATWGYGSVEELRHAGATAIADRPSQLFSMLSENS
jgi:phosphoglycolate phosphatase